MNSRAGNIAILFALGFIAGAISLYGFMETKAVQTLVSVTEDLEKSKQAEINFHKQKEKELLTALATEAERENVLSVSEGGNVRYFYYKNGSSVHVILDEQGKLSDIQMTGPLQTSESVLSAQIENGQ